ncbi:MAG: hypothetical protein ACYDEO_18060, partial [Aggregatilineales bacterium]
AFARYPVLRGLSHWHSLPQPAFFGESRAEMPNIPTRQDFVAHTIQELRSLGVETTDSLRATLQAAHSEYITRYGEKSSEKFNRVGASLGFTSIN